VRELVAAADAINHAIISSAELQAGLLILVPAGYVSCSAEGLAPTAAALVLWQQRTSEGMSFLESWPSVSTALAPLAAKPPAEQVAVQAYVSAAAYTQAVESYVTPMVQPPCPHS